MANTPLPPEHWQRMYDRLIRATWRAPLKVRQVQGILKLKSTSHARAALKHMEELGLVEYVKLGKTKGEWYRKE
jgi:Mn-dependent DtxR family transcriptional regulator